MTIFFGGQADTNMFIFWQSFSLDKERVLTLINLSLLKIYILYFLLEDYRKNMEEYLRDRINMTVNMTESRQLQTLKI